MPYICEKNLIIFFSLLAFLVLNIADSCTVRDLPNIPNAHPTGTGSDTDFRHGESVEYNCDAGYKVANGTAHVLCLEKDGITSWGTPTLNCVPEDCGEPPDLYNAEKGQVQGRGPPYPAGSKATYSCLIGYYKQEGTDIADCIRERDGKTRWTKPTLECRAEHCGDPGTVMHAERDGFLFTYPNKVTYTCDRGYSTNDKTVLFCLPRGTWSDEPPTCEIIHCPEPADPANGQVRYQETHYQSVAVYSCSEGYMIQGDRERHCTGDQTWSGSEPICIEVHCEPFTLSPGSHIVHGKTSGKPGDLVIIKCMYGVGRKTLKCTDSGEWSSPPLQCEVPPPTITTSTATPRTVRPTSGAAGERLKCDDPGLIPHGSLIENHHNLNFPTDMNLTFECDSGYKMNGHATLHCLPTGKWEPSILPACDKIIPIGFIIGFVVGGIFLVILALVTVGLYFRKRKRKSQNAVCLKRKANSIDARDIEETCCLEREKRPIPVTSL